MHTGRYWDPETKSHTSGEGPGGRAYSALPYDWDGDGDLDLIVGNNAGGLFLRENEGTATEPKFATSVQAIDAESGPASVPGGYAMPVAADWDGDGVLDLLSGSQNGGVYWFRNAGKDGAPKLEDPMQLVAPTESDGPIRSQVCVADFDDDGDQDLLVGRYSRTGSGAKAVRQGLVSLYRRESVAVDAAKRER